MVDNRIIALLRFRDRPRQESAAFVGHLGARHGVTRLILSSGDRESEVRYLARLVRIDDVWFGQSPEQKVALVDRETHRQPTLFVGDGVNDAPAMLRATAAVALGQSESVAAEAAHAVVLDGTLGKVDELMHIGRRTKRIAMQSAVGGMAFSVVGMGLAVAGWLPALAGAIAQEILDALTVLNALRAALRPAELTDFSGEAGADRAHGPDLLSDTHRAPQDADTPARA
jgi:P-type E1-E2 ATPase